jgi:hypothetical protein
MRQVAHPAVDAGIVQARRQFVAQQKAIDAKVRLFLPVLPDVIPEGVAAFVGRPFDVILQIRKSYPAASGRI